LLELNTEHVHRPGYNVPHDQGTLYYIINIGAIRGLMVEWEKSPDVSYGLSDTEGASLATGGFHS